MVSPKSFFLPIIIVIIIFIAAVLAEDPYFCNLKYTTADTTYQTNLNTLLSTLTSNLTYSNSGYYYLSLGQNPDRANAIALCIGDVSTNDCRTPLFSSRYDLVEFCPNYKEAILWNDFYMLRYSNHSIFGVKEEAPVYRQRNDSFHISDPGEFNKRLKEMLDKLSSAASGGSSMKFATGKFVHTDSEETYALVQCTTDLSQSDCASCLYDATEETLGFCNGSISCKNFRPSCLLRYGKDKFFKGDTQLEYHSESKVKEARNVIIIVVPIGVSVLFVILVCIYLRLRKQKKKAQYEDDIRTADSLKYDFSTIALGTENFAETNKLGQGGFGTVYKGKLPGGQDIAVKRLSKGSHQGDLEFKNEILLMAKLQHRNLVRLLGFCLEGQEMLLIYEFLPNGSLDHFIFEKKKCPHLDWARRYKIIADIARGVLYLHEDSRLRIIHRDLKLSNILLDSDLNAKISDFGMARLFAADEIQGDTTGRIVGTFGYMAPEYVIHGNFSVKSDVFSFGVIVLEIISGMRNTRFNDVENLLCHAWRSWKDGTTLNLIDPTLNASDSAAEMKRCIHIGLLCVQDNLAKRPTMASVVLMLNNSIALPAPLQPAFYMHDNRGPRGDLQTRQSNNSESKSVSTPNISITELYPR